MDAGVSIAIADADEGRAVAFFAKHQTSFLSGIVKFVGYEMGRVPPAPAFEEASRLVAQLRTGDLSSAIVTVVGWLRAKGLLESAVSDAALRKRLSAVRGVDHQSEIRAIYRFRRRKVAVRRAYAVDGERIVLSRPGSREELHELFARALAELACTNLDERELLTDVFFRLVGARSFAQRSRYLQRRGIPWSPPRPIRARDPAADGDGVDVAFSNALWESIDNAAARLGEQDASRPIRARSTRSTAGRQLQLPDFAEVEALERNPASEWKPALGAARARNSRNFDWTPPTPADVERDRQIGRRGEEVVLRRERERVAALGYDPSQVIWVSSQDAGADHDIRSIDDDGEPIWIEVKSTVGRDGRFEWSLAELTRAIKERDRYVLCRVYEAGTRSPTIVRFRDPAGMIPRELLRVEMQSVRARVEPLTPGDADA